MSLALVLSACSTPEDSFRSEMSSTGASDSTIDCFVDAFGTIGAEPSMENMARYFESPAFSACAGPLFDDVIASELSFFDE